MPYQPIINYKTKAIIFDLQKPIYGSFYAVWDKWFKGKENFKVIVNTPEGTSTYRNFRAYKKGAERLERYFKNPNVPMIFWGRHFMPDIKEREDRKKAEARIIGDFTIPDEVRMRLREKAVQIGLI